MTVGGEFSVPYCSDGVVTIFRLTPEQVCSHVESIFARIHPQDYERFLAAIHQSAQNLNLWFCTFRVQFEDGSVRWLEGNAQPELEPDGAVLWHGFINDVTERKQVEMELSAAKEAAIMANQAKSEFLANMSHEIRTPMNAILGFSSILNDLITDPTHRYYLNAIERSGKTLLQLINDILDLSKIEAGKLTLQYTPVSLASLLDDIRLVFSQKSHDKELDFSILIDEKLPENLLLDEIRLRQVLLNLVGNAVKFTETGFIQAAVTVQRTLSEHHLDVSIRIHDSGMGIAYDQQEAIFSPFTQQKQQSVRYGGTGLGLPICRRLIEMMGGTISVISQVGQGSCFTIQLPSIEICALAEPQRKAATLPLQAVHFQPAQVLVVDDSEINRQVLKAYLEDYPELELIDAENGEQVLALIRHYNFALILMDRIMPGENGDTVCEKIRALPDYAAIPIIMISASVVKLSPQQPVFYDLQLSKPINKTDLLMALQSFLSLDTRSDIALPPHTVQTQETRFAHGGTIEKPKELLQLLIAYQHSVTQISDSGGFDINELIDIAEQLLQIAEQYQCRLLVDWATTLKNQAQLFDITHLARTLIRFEELLKQLNQGL
jgi:PAS domain S-box-containing protein